ncbi:MAG TPA: hypothetical protein VIK01_26100, partial [Polyangiaceae bacterium]
MSYASHWVGDVCNPGVSFVEADAKYSGPLYGRSSCMAMATGTSASVFSVKPASDDAFPALESTTLTTDAGRLKPMYLSAADGGCFFQNWWDDQLQTPCSFESQYAG